LLLAAFVVSQGGCGSGPLSQSPSSPESPSSSVDASQATASTVAPPVPPLKFDDCEVADVDARCATVSVPETRGHDDDVSVPIRVVVVEATSASSTSTPMVLLSGGPGGSAVNDAPAFLDRFAALRTQHDLVFVEQRGTGTSGAVQCGPLPLNVRGGDALFSAGVEWAKLCLSSTDTDVAQYGTATFVDDLDEILEQLGYDSAHVYGGSYGALAAQVLAIRHPERVATMTLDGVSGLGVPIIANIPRDSQRALDLLAARCAADADCRAAYPDPIADLTAVLDRLRTTPVELSVTDPATGAPLMLDDVLAAQAIHALVLYTDTAPSLPGTLRAAALGIYDYLEQVVERIVAATEVNRLAMYATIRCSEPWASPTPDESRCRELPVDRGEHAGAVLRRRVLRVASRRCRPRRDRAPGNRHPDSAPCRRSRCAEPALRRRRRLLRSASNTTTVTAAGHGHGIVQYDCVGDAVATFVDNETISDADRACVAAR
jgi:pimeloyl-ACP methyl ester carboxylesterase